MASQEPGWFFYLPAPIELEEEGQPVGAAGDCRAVCSRIERQFVCLRRRADRHFEIHVAMKDGSSFHYPSRFYEVKRGEATRIALQRSYGELADVSAEFDMDQVEKVEVHRSPVILTAEEKEMRADMDVEIAVNTLQADGDVREHLAGRPDFLMIRYGG